MYLTCGNVMGVTMPGKFLSKVNYLMDLELLEGASMLSPPQQNLHLS
jgi:hypothetical protein